MSQYGSSYHGKRGRRGWGRGRGRGRGDNMREYSEGSNNFENTDGNGERHRDRQRDGAYGDDYGGYRGRGGGRGRKRGRDYRDNSGDGSQSAGGRRRGGPPAGLRGREIGMWYAARSKHGKKEREEKNSVLQLDSEKERDLSSLLANIRSAEGCPPQPKQRHWDPFQDEEYQDFNTSPSSDQKANEPNSRISTPQSYSAYKNQTDAFRSDRENLYSSKNSNESEKTGAKSSLFDSAQSTLETSNSSEIAEQEVANSDDSSSIGDDELESYGLSLYESDEEEETGFLFEFRKHNLENRKNSLEDLRDLPAHSEISLQRDEDLDRRLLQNLHEKQRSDKYVKMMEFRKKLPSYKMKEEVVSLVNSNQVVVISGETGCGKTTQVSQFILDDYIENGKGSLCRVVCTQPRRISAIAVAERVADERVEKCGESTVGYQIRLEARKPKDQGSILYCTTGILLQWLASDKLLSKTSHVILDEVHERDLHTDFLMIIVRDILPKRPDLKLILMSATLNAEQFSEYFYNCPMMNIPGFTFPVKEFLLEDILELTFYKCTPQPVRKKRLYGRRRKEDTQMQELENYKSWCQSLTKRYSRSTVENLKLIEDFEMIDIDLCAYLTEYICREKRDGAILVFLPGWAEIKKLKDTLEARTFFKNKSKFLIIPLHSLMPTVNQKQVFDRPPAGVRKIIIATNIAETSITIDDVVYVIDCGKIKMKNYDPENNIQTLKPEWVSKANAKQRRGRAGRVQPGECYHMYTQFHEDKLEDYQLPEILRTRLEELCLHIKLLKMGYVEPFVKKAMQPPSLAALKQSLQILLDLNALDEHEDLTPLGYHLAKMPVDPHSGKMLLYAALFSCVDPIMTVAASLSFKDAFYVPLGQEMAADMRKKELSAGSQSDHIMLINAYKGWERAKQRGTQWQYCRENFLSPNTLQMLSDMRRQFAVLLHEMKFLESPNPKSTTANRNSDNMKILKAVICAGLFPNVAQLVSVRENPKPDRPHKLKTQTDRKVIFHPKSVNSREVRFTSQWIIYHLKMQVNAICLFDSTVVSPLSLLFFGGEITVAKGGEQDKHSHRVNIGGHVTLITNKKTCDLVRELRIELDQLLEHKITHPGSIDWNPRTKEGAVIHAIIDLIKTEVEKPPDFSRGRKNEEDMTCYNCGEKGHSSKNCRY